MGVRLPDRDLAYLPEDHPAFAAYMRDLNWAQQFALHNRNEMMDRVLTEVSHAVYGEDGHQADAGAAAHQLASQLHAAGAALRQHASGSPARARSRRARPTGR